MAAEESSEEITLITIIQSTMDQFSDLIEQHRWQDVADLVLKVNRDAEWIINNYSVNHPSVDNSQEVVDWSFLSTSLNLSTDKLQSGFINLNGMFQSNDIERVVRMILRAGTIRDYDCGGLVLLSFIFCFLFLQESRHGPYEHLTYEFYTHLEDYSSYLLVSSILSIPPFVSFITYLL